MTKKHLLHIFSDFSFQTETKICQHLTMKLKRQTEKILKRNKKLGYLISKKILYLLILKKLQFKTNKTVAFTATKIQVKKNY